MSLVWELKDCDLAVRAGRFAAAREAFETRELSELTLGLVGFGRIGRAVGRRAVHGHLMTVLYNDLVQPIPGAPGFDFDARGVDKETLYSESDIVSLHIPLTRQTRGLIDAAALARFKPGAYLINTSRGAVVDGAALADALLEGRLRGAALDVFDPEPPALDQPLLRAPHTLFTPHIAARTGSAQQRMNAVVDDVIRVLRGEPPQCRAW
jgi:phosphoglycerate dehydrogenase-like enzyme